jgi:hypothetical protein
MRSFLNRALLILAIAWPLASAEAAEGKIVAIASCAADFGDVTSRPISAAFDPGVDEISVCISISDRARQCRAET